jgi:VanZ family protein
VKLKMTFKQGFVKYALPVIFWMGFIFWMSTGTFSSENTASYVETVLRFFIPKISSHELNSIHALFRKSGHFIEYFILGLLLFRAFRGSSIRSWNRRWSFFAVILVVLWAAGDELHQSFVLTRTASVSDMVIDIAGGVLAQFAILLRHVYRRK